MLTSSPGTCKQLPVTLLMLAFVAGCTTVESQSFTVSNSDNIESAQIATDADFGRYDRLTADEMGIYFPAGHATTAEEQQRIRQIFRTAFLAELDGYTIVGDAGPSTMKVQASLIDLRSSAGGQVPPMRREIQEVAKSGSIRSPMSETSSLDAWEAL